MGLLVQRIEVLNCRTPGFIFDEKTMVMIDRRTPWGNPYIVGVHGSTREDVVMLHINWLRRWSVDKKEEIHKIGIREYSNKWVMENIGSIRGKHPVCWCAPDSCHGGILLMLANVS